MGKPKSDSYNWFIAFVFGVAILYAWTEAPNLSVGQKTIATLVCVVLYFVFKN